jgi:glycosyltransferase domain-containing protein
MAKLFIPTRNRPASLSKVLEYLITFFPETEVIIADGSDEHHQSENQAKVSAICRRLSIDYRPFPAELGFFERCLDVINSLDDDFLFWGADDDYPNMELLKRGEAFLRKNPDYVAAMGPTIKLRVNEYGEIISKISMVRPIVSKHASTRMRYYSQWSFPTTYAAMKGSHIVERIERLRSYGQPGFFDFVGGLYDTLKGKICALPDVGFFATYMSVHSRLRPRNKLHFLDNSDNVLAIHRSIKEDLDSLGETDPGDVVRIAQRIILNRIAEISGWGFKKSARFLDSKCHLDPVVQTQYRITENLFKEGTEMHQKYVKHLDFIYKAMKYVEKSDDNKSEPKTLDRDSFRI